MKTPLRYAMVFFASLAILLIGIARAPMTFDEPSYVGAARNFIAGTPSINPEHPPLAKYIIALSIEGLGDKPFGWRFPSAIAGALLALAIFGLTFELAGNLRTSYVAWLLTIANGFWFAMSRVAMLSIFEMAFEAAGVWMLIAAAQRTGSEQPSEAVPEGAPESAPQNDWLSFAASGALFGLSIGSRWCGAVGLLVCAVYAMVYCRPFGKRVAAMAGAAGAVYTITWIPLLVREGRTARALLTANQFIFEFHRHAQGDPRLGQMWWTWIFRFHQQPSLSYLVGNPVIGVLGLIAVGALVWKREPLLPALYLAHVMQWAIALKPLTFYYYYFEAFTWLTVALALAMQGVAIRRVRLDVVVTAVAAAAFAYWFPA